MTRHDPKPQLPPGISEMDLSPIRRFYMPDSAEKRRLQRISAEYSEQLIKWQRRQARRARYKANPEVFRELNARRGARLRTAAPRWEPAQVLRRVYAEARKRKFEVDHIVPMSSPHVCGLHVWANLQLLTKQENIRKGNREWPDQWEPVDDWMFGAI
jgi:5-methylcytosine-specific restriction endonuclease McrA